MKIPRVIRKLISGSREGPKLEPEVGMPWFDEAYYCFWYVDVRQYEATPWQHYHLHGWREGRNPSAGFSTDGYLKANPDVREAGLNPLSHYLKFGRSEGRKGWERNSFSLPPGARPPGHPLIVEDAALSED